MACSIACNLLQMTFGLKAEAQLVAITTSASHGLSGRPGVVADQLDNGVSEETAVSHAARDTMQPPASDNDHPEGHRTSPELTVPSIKQSLGEINHYVEAGNKNSDTPPACVTSASVSGEMRRASLPSRDALVNTVASANGSSAANTNMQSGDSAVLWRMPKAKNGAPPGLGKRAVVCASSDEPPPPHPPDRTPNESSKKKTMDIASYENAMRRMAKHALPKALGAAAAAGPAHSPVSFHFPRVDIDILQFPAFACSRLQAALNKHHKACDEATPAFGCEEQSVARPADAVHSQPSAAPQRPTRSKYGPRGRHASST